MKKIVLAFLSAALLLGLLSGCGANDAFNGVANEKSMEIYDGEIGMTASGTYDLSAGIATDRKLIRTVDLRVETQTYDALIGDVETQIAAAGGYLESIDADMRASSTCRFATLVIRVPADRLDAMVNTLGELSNVVYRSENRKDITTTYVDTQSHRDALKIEQERLLALLEEAESLQDILEIESRLTDVRYQLESIESQLRTYDNQVDYATITLYVEEVNALTDTEEKGFWQKIGDGFMNSLRGVWSGTKTVFSAVIIALPYLLVLAVLSAIVLSIVWLCIKKQRKVRRDPQIPPEER